MVRANFPKSKICQKISPKYWRGPKKISKISKKSFLDRSVKTRIDSNSGASEISRINRCGFNFDVAPLFVGIWCLLIFRVGDVGDVGGAWGKSKAQRLDSEVRINSRRFGVRSRVSDQGSELWSEIKGFRNKDWRVRIVE